MRIRLAVVLTSVLVAVVGIVTLLGLLINEDFGTLGVLVAQSPVRGLADLFLRLAALLIALTVLIGVLNLFVVNVTRLTRGSTLSARIGSLVLLVSFLGVIGLRVLDSANATSNARRILETVQVPIGASLNGLLFFVLVWGALRILQRGITRGRLLFVIVVLITLVGSLLDGTTLLQQAADWLMEVPVSAGSSGILLGIALATLVAGVRVIIGQDRQYGE